MSQAAAISWEDANQSWLMVALSEVRADVARFLSSPDPTAFPPQQPLPDARPSTPPAAALEMLCATFGLSPFERKILLMCAGVELDSQFAKLCQTAAKDLRHALPTFSLALSAFEDAHWSALLPARPLRHWHLIEVASGETLTTSGLRIDERVLHYLVGASSIDERLRGLAEPVRSAETLPPSQRAVADRIAAFWSRGNGQAPLVAVQLCGSEPAGKRSVAAAACARLGLNLHTIPARLLPRGAGELDLFIRLWEREAGLHPGGLLVECDDSDPADPSIEVAVNRLLETVRSPVLIAVRERRKPRERSVLSFDVPGPTAVEQHQMWNQALGETAAALNGTVDALVSQFNLNQGSIFAAASGAVASGAAVSVAEPEAAASNAVAGQDSANDLAAGLWEACRVQARPRMEGLAQRIEPSATWDDLVLPGKQKQLLVQIAMHVRQRSKVYRDWGFAAKGSRGLGISALFAGPSGTGKTMAGEVLASQLRLDLYRIDLSQVISKYIGETEKSLRRVFDAAEEGAAILLFDEADALFGKRSEVKDSHDRYANIEVSYLLQRMETYRGLAILTTNRRDALDPAFLRRIRFAVEFPFPDAAHRAEIWRRVFPRQTPTEGLRVDRLARLNAAGGNIHNIAMGAAFLAADAGEPVRMAHLLSAARTELSKLERPLTDAETAGWI